MNKCAHCGVIDEELHEFKAEPKEGIPAFRLCKPCARILADQLIRNVSKRPYGISADDVRVLIIKNFIQQK